MNKKVGLTISAILLVICLVIFIIFKAQEESDNKEEVSKFLIINNYSYWEYDGSWQTVDNSEDPKEKFSVYVDNSFLGKYNLSHVQSWNIFDSSNNFISYDGDLFAFSDNFNVSLKKFSVIENDTNDLKEIEAILEQTVNSDILSINEKVAVDLDSNGVMDKIISVSNLDIDGQEKYFNLVFIVLNGKRQILINEIIEEKDLLITPIYNIEYIFIIDDDVYNNIVIQRGYFSNAGKNGNILFQYKDLEYKIGISD